jgi:hypothetical protein
MGQLHVGGPAECSESEWRARALIPQT